MRIAIVELGRMGMNMARRLLQGGHEVVASNRSPGGRGRHRGLFSPSSGREAYLTTCHLDDAACRGNHR